MANWPEATVMIWYPILPAGRQEDLLAGLKLKFLRHEVSFNLKDGEGMTGSGLALVNAPYGTEKCLARAVELASPILKT
jgi:23S rRNA A2030 N6-methylase RlmJ